MAHQKFECLVFLDLWGINPFAPKTIYTRLRFLANSLIILLDILAICFEVAWNWQSLYITLGGAVEVASSVLQVPALLCVYSLIMLSIIIFAASISHCDFLRTQGQNCTKHGQQYISIKNVTKVILLVTYRRMFQHLQNTIDSFYDINKLESKLKEEILNYHRMARNTIRAYISSMILTAIIYYARPFVMRQRFLPLRIYEICDIQSNLCYGFLYIFQLITITTIATAFMGFDGLFLIYMMYAYCEIKVVKYLFKNIDLRENEQEENSAAVKEFSKVARHHDNVLKFISDINSIYSLQLLVQFISFTVMICFGLFLILASGFPPDMERLFKCTSYISVYVIQLCFYCIMGTAIIHQTTSVADAVYDLKWWVKPQKNIRKGIVMVMRRSLKSEKITIGGFTELNLASFMFVLKTTYSFLALMQTVVQQ